MSEAQVNESNLDAALVELEKAKKWSPRVISKFEAFIYSENEEDVFCANPIRFASEKNVQENEAIDIFLYASHLKIFTMNWMLICPICSGMVESFGSLSGLHADFYCSLCQFSSVANMDDMIQINFTIRPEIRDIRFHHPADLSLEEYLFKYRLRPEGQFVLRDGRKLPMREAMKHDVLFLGTIEKNETKHLEYNCKVGVFSGYNIHHDFGFSCQVKSTPQNVKTCKIVISSTKATPETTTLEAGTIHFDIENQSMEKCDLVLFNHEEINMSMNLEFVPFLTGKRLITHQTFRDLFRFETVSGNEGIGVKNITFLFTDLKGSTALYDRIGDLKAYSLVQQHFDRLSKVIVAHSGSIVKTIGDAIMATFMTPVQATQAAFEMLTEIENFNQSLQSQEIILKIGIHQGASIVVTLNDRLDYFGQTVNIAARVQGLADAEEIYLTESVFNSIDPKSLQGFDVARTEANLKGIQEGIGVYKVSKRPATLASYSN